MDIKSQDIVVALKFVSTRQSHWTYADLSRDLGISTSQIHAAVQRANNSRLLMPAAVMGCEGNVMPNIENLREFLIHGVKYTFVAQMGPQTRGIPTSYSAPVLSKHLNITASDKVVWPDPTGSDRGQSFSPIHKMVPFAASVDESLYEMLALVDAIRGGNARERNLAVSMISDRLSQYEP